MLQCLLQLGEPLGHQMDVLQGECTTVSRTGLFVAQYKIKSYSGLHTIVSSIYAPRFATLALVKSVGGACMWDLTFYLANTPPLPGPRLDADIGTVLYHRPVTEADLTPICLCFSCPPETGRSRSTDRGWPKCRQRVCPSNVLVADWHHSRTCLWSTANSLAVLWTLASLLRCHGDLKLDSVGVSTKIVLVEWPWLGGLYAG